MDAKNLIKNKSMCVLPWTGFYLETDGRVRSCVAQDPRSPYGNIRDSSLQDIIHGPEALDIKQQMKADAKPTQCNTCHVQEHNQKRAQGISSRLYYNREVGSRIDLDVLDDDTNFELRHVDLRWDNTCNQACVYCDPTSSSMWARELKQDTDSAIRKTNLKVRDYVYDNVHQLVNVYLAGGEPLLMKQNLELLQLLKERNPKCTIRVNTNLSKTDTGIFEKLCEFENVHWIVSCESIGAEYEYIRYHGNWNNFVNNLDHVKSLDHKISFNMLHTILNYQSILECVDHFKDRGFHDNSFIMGPLFGPLYFSVRHLPQPVLEETIQKFEARKAHATDNLKNGLENCLNFMRSPHTKNIQLFEYFVNRLDKRRKQDWRKTFPKLAEVYNV